MKHTPGPWKAHKKSERIGCAEWEIHWSDDGECVADVVYEEGDAKLIAAAPELLEALKEVESALDVGIYDSADFMGWLKDYGLDMVRKAIAKAKGETT